ncbi:hypothetical protein KCU78_g5025, partial [Aureobasidium melanogenum]
MAEPNTSPSTAMVPSTTSATKRSSDGDASPSKRQKTTQQNDERPIFNLNIVALKRKGTLVAQVPLLNFRSFHAEKAKDLVEISETKNDCWKFYYYDASALCTHSGVKRWASWLEHWNLRAFVKDALCFSNSLLDAQDLGDIDYQDALVDAWMLWLQDGQCKGSLRVDRLRARNTISMAVVELHICLDDLGKALILHHDVKAGMADDKSSEQHYRDHTRNAIRELAQDYFSHPEREPKDPLQLSADEFCKKYNSHQEKNLPCYKTKKLPEQLSLR